MAINSNTKFLGVDSSKVNLVEKKDGINNAKQEYYTAQEIVDAVGGGVPTFSFFVTQSGSSAPVINKTRVNTTGLTWSITRSLAGVFKIIPSTPFTLSTFKDVHITYSLGGNYAISTFTLDNNGNIEWSTIFPTDGNPADLADFTSIEIKIYQ